MKILFWGAFFFLPNYCNADIKGKVLNEQGKPLAGVIVLLLDSSAQNVVKSCISNQEGQFIISIQQAGDYTLSIKSSTYAPALPQKIEYMSDVTLPDIKLLSLTKQLKEVNIVAEKPLIEVKGGKIIMNVKQSIGAAGASVFDMIQRAPSVSIDNNDNIALRGKQGVQIMLDGKPMIVQGSELANLLKSMPATAIEKVELMSNPDAQYDAAGTGGIINLKSKKEKRQGYNGTAQLGLGQGVYNKSNSGLNLNYRKDKINVFLNSAISLRKGFNQLDLDRIFIKDNDYNGSYKQDNYAVIRLQNYSINSGVDYSLSKKTTVGMATSFAKTSYTFDGVNNGRLYDSLESYRSYFLSNNHQKNSASNYALNTNLRHTFDSLGCSFSFDADYARFNTDNGQTQATDYFFPNGNQEKPRYVLDGTMKGYTEILAVKSDYVHPLNSSSKMEAGFKLSTVVSDNKPDFYDASSAIKIFDSGKSNHFIYHENISAAYLNYNKDWKAWSLQAGLRYEHTRAKGDQLTNGQNFDRNYGQLFPNIITSYTASSKHQFSLSLSRRIDRPNYQQLNPFKNYIDPTSIHQGNPYLNPSFSYSAELAHTFSNRFSTSITFSKTDAVITQVIILDEQKITLVTDRNLATNRLYSFNGNYPFKIFKWWSSIESFSFYYSIYEGNLSNTPLRTGIPTAYLSTNNTFTFPKNWSAELNSWFSSDQRYGYMYLRPMYAINLGVQKQFWNNNATLKISLTDIFRAQNPTGITQFSNYLETFVVTRDTRTINCSFSYRFGNSKWQRQRREGGADEERRRAGTGGQAT
jgi:hypothetical protein